MTSKARAMDIYRQMSRAELEIIKLKKQESTAWERQKRSTLGSFGAGGTVQEDEEEDDEERKPYDEADEITKLYR